MRNAVLVGSRTIASAEEGESTAGTAASTIIIDESVEDIPQVQEGLSSGGGVGVCGPLP